MRFTFPSRTCKSSILPASASSSLRQDERGQERSISPESSSASRHNDEAIDAPPASQRAVRVSRYGSVAPRPA